MTRFLLNIIIALSSIIHNLDELLSQLLQGELIAQLGERRTWSQGRRLDPHPGRGVVSLSKTLHPP